MSSAADRLYSGARLEEIAGLRVQDIKEVEGVLYFSFEPHEERRLKTASSRRQVPLYPELARCGLLDHMEALPKNGRLFPELKPGPHGKLAGAFSKWWGRFTDEQGSADALKTFHSLRHTFTDALRRAKVEPEVRSQLLGPSAGNMTARYGSGHDLRSCRLRLLRGPGFRVSSIWQAPESFRGFSDGDDLGILDVGVWRSI